MIRRSHHRLVGGALVPLIAACAGGGPAKKPSATPAPAARAPIVFTPSGSGARVYNGPPGEAPPRSPLVDAVLVGLAEVATESKRSLPLWDSRLYAVASDLAQVVPDESRLSYSAIEFALHHHGIIEPTPHLLVIWTALRNPGPLSEFVTKKMRELLARGTYARMGIGIAERDTERIAIVIVVQRSHLETEPVARVLPATGRLKLRGRVLPPYQRPEVLVTRGDGRVSPAGQRRKADGSFSAHIPCGKDRGRLQVEISGTGPEGATVLANFPVWCGIEPPAQLALSPSRGIDDPAGDTRVAEAALIDSINQARRRAGLAALALDEAVAEVARRYSQEMVRSGEVAHVSRQSGSADDRLRNAGVVRPVVQENLARAATADEVHRSLMNSPGHRANILSREATHVGVGVEFGTEDGSNDLFVTQLFVRVTPAIDARQASGTIESAIRGGRRLRVDAELGRVAQSYANELARGVSKSEAAAKAAKGLSSITGRYGRVRTLVMAVSDVTQVAPRAVPQSGGTTHFGVGVAQGHHERLGDGAIYVVVVFGQRA